MWMAWVGVEYSGTLKRAAIRTQSEESEERMGVAKSIHAIPPPVTKVEKVRLCAFSTFA